MNLPFRIFKFLLKKETEIITAHFTGLGINLSAEDFWKNFTRLAFFSIFKPVKGPTIIEDCYILSYHTPLLPSLVKWTKNLNTKLTIVVRAPRNVFLELLYHLLEVVYPVNICYRFNISRIQAASKCVFFIDQDTRAKGEFVPFFGIEAKTPVTVFRLAVEMNKPLFFLSYSVRENYVQINLEEIKATSPQQMANTFNLLLESAIKTDLCSWCWFHKRWRSRRDKIFNHEEYIHFFSSRSWLR